MRVFLFRIPIPEWTECHSIHSAPRGRMNRMLRMKSKMADGEVSAADSNTSLQGKKSGYSFGQNETLLLISLYQKYKENCCDNGCNGSLFVGRHICYAMFTRPGPTGVFLCRQSELFLAFRTNHSYSRIVDKKRALSLRWWNASWSYIILWK